MLYSYFSAIRPFPNGSHSIRGIIAKHFSAKQASQTIIHNEFGFTSIAKYNATIS